MPIGFSYKQHKWLRSTTKVKLHATIVANDMDYGWKKKNQ